MKRYILIIIGAVIVGKLFASELLRLAESSSTTSKNLGQHLYLDKQDNAQLKLDHVKSQLDMVRHFPQRTFALNKPLVLPKAPVKPLVSKVTKTDDKKSKEQEEAKKKDEERRKRRQKALEDQVAKVAQTPVVTNPQALAPTTPNDPYNTSYVALPLPGANAGANNVATNPGAVTLVQTPVALGHVSTLANNAVVSGWIRVLTTTPSVAAMTSFEAQLTNKTITQGEYYQVLAAMQASANTESRSLAVQGANLYQNISSFKILADESTNESVATIKQLANSDVRSYDTAANLALLTSASTSGDPAEQAVAKAFLAGLTQTTTATTTAPTSTFHL